MLKLVILLITCFLVACSGTSNTTTASTSTYDDKSDGVVCRLEAPVGSNRKRKICTSANEREQMREAAREGMLRTQTGTMTSGADQ